MQLDSLLCRGTVWPLIDTLVNLSCFFYPREKRLWSSLILLSSCLDALIHLLLPLPLSTSPSSSSSFSPLSNQPSITHPQTHGCTATHTHTLCAGRLHRLISPHSDTFGAAACGLLIMSTADDSHHAFPFLPNNAASHPRHTRQKTNTKPPKMTSTAKSVLKSNKKQTKKKKIGEAAQTGRL